MYKLYFNTCFVKVKHELRDIGVNNFNKCVKPSFDRFFFHIAKCACAVLIFRCKTLNTSIAWK